jgi:hypothetical protein
MHSINNSRIINLHSVKITRILSKEKLTRTSTQFEAGTFQSFKLVFRPNNAINFSYCYPKHMTSRLKLFMFRETIDVYFSITGNTAIQILGSRVV